MGAQQRRDDRRLLRRILAGQRDACEELVRAHYGSIFAFLYDMTADAHLAEDLTQETFAAAWRAIAGFRGSATFGTWLHRIAYGKFIDVMRDGKRRKAAMEALKADCPEADSRPDPLDRMAADERSRTVVQAVHALPERERAVVVLHYLEGLSLRETASVLGEPSGTVKSRTNQALQHLRALLDGRL